MSTGFPAGVATLLRERAGGRCEVCAVCPDTPQMDVPLPFGTYTCQHCGNQEDTANADQYFPLCTLCTGPVDNGTRTPEERPA